MSLSRCWESCWRFSVQFMKPQKEHTLPEAFDCTASCARSLWSHWARVGVGPPIWNSTDVTVKQAHVILRPSLNACECEGDRWLWRGQTLTKDAEIQHAVLSTLEIPLPVLVGPHQCWGCRSAVWKEALCHALPSCKSLWESKDVYSRNCMLKTEFQSGSLNFQLGNHGHLPAVDKGQGTALNPWNRIRSLDSDF